MIIKYIGHACFKILDDKTGYSIILDPYRYGSVPGFGKIVDVASEVLCSHGHDDHAGSEHVKIEPKEESPFKVEYIDTFHDPEKGALRGENRIYVITNKRTGEKLVHYGDIGEKFEDLLTEENLVLLKDADIALVPVGGVYTYDMLEALELIDRTTPKLAIPMHFRSEIAGFGLPNIDSLEKFMDTAAGKGKKVGISRVSFINTGDIELGSDILVLRPQNF
ncbi:MAG: MBL fold metallo-hydrolase [Mogibacterium sp.]|nr:MBL fold metallo-hydrolase [Mogibacterium sp.]